MNNDNQENHLSPHFLEITPETWDDAKRIGDRLSTYVFRGQGDKDWPLETTLERLARQYSIDKSEIAKQERKILKVFKSRAHHYLQHPPADSAGLEWLSIIQDYGGPTRLLDFTGSFYVAAFFAIDSARKDASIWAIAQPDLTIEAIFSDKINSSLYDVWKENNYDPDAYNKFAEGIINNSTHGVNFILKIIPSRLNERLAVQQGSFLFNCDIENSFEYNLCKTLKLPFDELKSYQATQLSAREFMELPIYKDSEKQRGEHLSIAPIIKLNLLARMHKEALLDLNTMNINHASLFPGLEGFAKSLKNNFIDMAELQATVKYHAESPKSQNG